MKQRLLPFLVSTLIASTGIANAKVIVVNTANNLDFGAGHTNLVYALQLLADGDTINFAIPGTGVHYIQTPTDGYPLITKNNITIDGYSQQQPGSTASPNTASINQPNNAQLMICLCSTNGNALSMYSAVTNFAGIDYPNLGFGDGEQALLGFFRATNVWVKGFAFLSSYQTSTSQAANGDSKTICFAVDAPDVSSLCCQGFHVSGCWFGVEPTTRQVAYMPDGQNLATPTICIATYGTGTNGTPGFPNVENMPGPGTIGVGAASANPRAEFNVFVTGYGFDSQGGPFRICGNFWGVLPDGVTLADISTLNSGNQQGDAFVEFGSGHDIVIGTDGDGVNDADEGNVFGSYAGNVNSDRDIYYYGSQANTIIAGNTFGVDIHGNSFGVGTLTVLIHHIGNNPTCKVRFGSDFNGVSAALEANTVADSQLFDVDTGSTTNSHWVSFRGNSLTNVSTPNISTPPIGDGQSSDNGLDIYNNFVDVTGVNGTLAIVPVIGAGTTTTTLAGTCGLPVAGPYTNLVIDLYEANSDPTMTPQGKRWLATFTDNSPADSNPAVGAFSFNIASLGLAHGTRVTMTVTYISYAPPTIETLGANTRTANVTTVAVSGTSAGGFSVWRSSTPAGPYTYAAPTAGGLASFQDTHTASFYRAFGPTGDGQTSPFSDVYTIP